MVQRTICRGSFAFASLLVPPLVCGAIAQDKPVKLGAEAVATQHASQNLLATLPGRWIGSGTAELANGHREPFNCVVTYMVNPGQTELKQGFRCESPNLKVATSAVLHVKGNMLDGTWEEKNYEKKGRVAGMMTANGGITATVQHQQRQAQVEIATNACDQVIEVKGRPGDMVRSIVAQLKRC